MQHRSNKNSKRLVSFITILLVGVLLSVGVTYAYVQNKMKMETAQMEHLVLTKATNIDNVLSKLLYKTQALSALVIQNSGDVQDFERVAATILDDPAIENLIIAPKGVVTMVYPLEGNEAVLNLDYFSDKAGNKEAIEARDNRQLVLGGPFNTVQGRQALVGRLPIYLKDEAGKEYFWGLVSVTLRYPEVLEGAELEQLRERGFAYEIWRMSPDTKARQIIAQSEYTYNPDARYVEQPLTILNAEWFFRLSPIKNWYQIPETWIFLCVGMFVSFLVASLAIYNKDLRQMQKSLENISYRDALTGALNRRGLFQLVEEIIADGRSKFVLCYIDLNGFKGINDTCGHAAGDQVLQAVATTFQHKLGKQDAFGRVGGDEFILIFSGSADERFHNMIGEVQKELRNTFFGQDLDAAFSIGYVEYPKDGRTLDELISKADNLMYQQKKEMAGGKAD